MLSLILDFLLCTIIRSTYIALNEERLSMYTDMLDLEFIFFDTALGPRKT